MNNKRVPRVSISFVNKLPRLLHMEYKPSEIAEELGITEKTIYTTYLLAGLPHRRDDKNFIWIVGTEFSTWARTVLQTGSRYAHQRSKQPLGDNEAYCCTCHAVRQFKTITKRAPMSAGRFMAHGLCSVCDGRMSIIKKVQDDQSQ